MDAIETAAAPSGSNGLAERSAATATASENRNANLLGGKPHERARAEGVSHFL